MSVVGLFIACGIWTETPPISEAEPAPVEVPVPKTDVVVFFDRNGALEPVPRKVNEKFVYRATVQNLFEGPTPEETARGLVFHASGATGFSKFRLKDGAAELTLQGACDAGGLAITLASHVRQTLLQFPDIRSVRIFDADGETTDPTDLNSAPRCLTP